MVLYNDRDTCFIRKLLLCTGWWFRKKLRNWLKCREEEVNGGLSYNTAHLVSHPFSKAQGPERKVVSVRGREDQGKEVSSGCESITHDTQQLRVPAQDQASQRSSMSSGGAHETPALTEVLWTSCWLQGDSSFSLRVWLLVDWPCSRG